MNWKAPLVKRAEGGQMKRNDREDDDEQKNNNTRNEATAEKTTADYNILQAILWTTLRSDAFEESDSGQALHASSRKKKHINQFETFRADINKKKDQRQNRSEKEREKTETGAKRK